VIAIGMYALLSIVLIMFLSLLLKTRFRLDFFNAFLVCGIVFYILIPFFLISNPMYLLNNSVNWGADFYNSYESIWIACLIVVLFFTLFLAMYYSFCRVLRFNGDNILLFSQFCQKNSYLFGVFFTVVGLIAFLLYSTTVGGPLSALLNAQTIRSGVLQGEGSLTFFKHFMRLSYLGSFFLFSRVYYSRIKVVPAFIFVLSLIVSIIISWAYAGRATMLSFIGVFFIFFISKNRMKLKSFLVVGLIVVLFLFVIVYMRPIIRIIGGTPVDIAIGSDLTSFIGSIIKAFSVSFSSLVVVVHEIELKDVFWGKGLSLAVFNILPKNLLGLDVFYTINAAHTQLFGYVLDSRQYTITTGIISYFIYDFWYAGILIGPIMLGFFTAVLKKIQDIVQVGTFLNLMLVYYILKMPAYFLNFDPASNIKGEFPIMISILFLLSFWGFNCSVKNYRKSGYGKS